VIIVGIKFVVVEQLRNQTRHTRKIAVGQLRYHLDWGNEVFRKISVLTYFMPHPTLALEFNALIDASTSALYVGFCSTCFICSSSKGKPLRTESRSLFRRYSTSESVSEMIVCCAAQPNRSWKQNGLQSACQPRQRCAWFQSGTRNKSFLTVFNLFQIETATKWCQIDVLSWRKNCAMSILI